MRPIVRVTFLSLVLSSAPALSQANSPPAATLNVAGQLAKIHQSLEGIRVLLGQDVESRELDLLFRRSEFALSRKNEVEKKLDSAQAERRGLEEQRSSYEASRESMLKQAEAGDFDMDDAQSHIFLEQMESHLERLEGRLREIDAEVGELEAELHARDRDLREWQDLLDRQLPSP